MFKQFIPITIFLAVSAFLAPESVLEGKQADWTKLAARCHEICQGPQGEIGPNGFPGVVGVTGPTGAQGEAGVQGQVGARGATGPTGGQGVIGREGFIGPNGPQGLAGYTGAAGTTGSAGPTGARGTTGIPGEDGSVLSFAWAVNSAAQTNIAPNEVVALLGFISQTGGYSMSPEGGVIVPDNGDYQIFFRILANNDNTNMRLEVNGFYLFPSAFGAPLAGTALTGNVILTLAKGDVLTIVNNNASTSFNTIQGEADNNRATTPASMTILQLTSIEDATASQECCDLLFGTDIL